MREPEPPAARHPHRDRLRDVLTGWYASDQPALGYVVTAQPYGILSAPRGVVGARLILTVDDPRDVGDAVRDARRRSGGSCRIWVDDRTRCDRLDAALHAAGCKRDKTIVHLALIGELVARSGPASLTVHDVDAGTLEEWAVTKLRCFANSEETPSRDAVASETSKRAPEMALAALRLARVDGEPAGILGYYAGADQLVFNLGTRVPHRHRGIAQALLSRWVAAGRAEGCRAFMINATEHGAPEALYRRMGFADEIYWYQEYDAGEPGGLG